LEAAEKEARTNPGDNRKMADYTKAKREYAAAESGGKGGSDKS
jgi:hypothetical protein